MNESKKEFWGTTPASLLATAGLLLTLLPLSFNLGLILQNVIGLIALAMIIAGIVINRHKGLDEKWRRINYKLHISILVLAIVVIVFYNCHWGF